MKEAILASLSGIHFRYMKTYSQSQALLDFEATIYHIPYRTGYSPKDWRVLINTMIEKKGKGNRVRDLRTINLIEVDFNFNNKIIAKELLTCMEQNNLLPNEQYGSRYSYYTAKQAVNKKLLFDLAYLL